MKPPKLKRRGFKAMPLGRKTAPESIVVVRIAKCAVLMPKLQHPLKRKLMYLHLQKGRMPAG
jgi:hypothetical protein